MLKAPYYQAWDKDVLDLYVEYALWETEGKIRLKMDRFQVCRIFEMSRSQMHAVDG